MKPDLHTPSPAFIIGTGRCGSALISSVLNTNPHVLSLSECLRMAGDQGSRNPLPEGILGAEEFAELIGSPGMRMRILYQHGLMTEEMLYQPGVGKAWGRDGNVPPMLISSLPHLTSEHDALYGELIEFVKTQAPASAAQHYARVFDWLKQRFGRKLWIERSGGNLRLAADLYKAFPQARFIHLVRDGRNCAISMHQHLGYRMQMLGMQLRHEFGYDPYAPGAAPITRHIPEQWQGLLPQNFQADALRSFGVPIPHCGMFWSNEIRAGLRGLEGIPQQQLLTLRYEDFLNAPEQTIARMAFFLDKDMVTVEWIRKAALKLRSPRSTWTNLDGKTRSELEAAVKPGFAALEDLYR